MCINSGFICVSQWVCLCIIVRLCVYHSGFVCVSQWFCVCIIVDLFVYHSGFVCVSESVCEWALYNITVNNFLYQICWPFLLVIMMCRFLVFLKFVVKSYQINSINYYMKINYVIHILKSVKVHFRYFIGVTQLNVLCKV